MIFRILTIGFFLSLAMTSVAVAASCPYIQSADSLGAQISRLVGQVNAMGINKCSASGMALQRQIISMQYQHAGIIRQASSNRSCKITGGKGAEESAVDNQKILDACVERNRLSAIKQKEEAERAARPQPKPLPQTEAPPRTVQPSQQPRLPQSSQTQSRGVCGSDITGHNIVPMQRQNCENAGQAMQKARTLEATNKSAAREEYRKAAEEYRKAGDEAARRDTIERLAKLGADILTDLANKKIQEKLPIPEVKITLPKDPSACEREIRPQMTAIDKKIQTLMENEPPYREGPQVPVGSCASRIAKLYKARFINGPAAGVGVTTVASKVANHEERACLELKKVYLEKTCKCWKQGWQISEDETMQDQMLEAYGAIQNLDKRARDRSIKNPIINKIVTEAAGVRDCFHMGAWEQLRQAERKLDGILKQTPSESSIR